MTLLDWVNRVRDALGASALDELAAAAPGDPSPGRRSRLAQSLPDGVKLYVSGQGVYAVTTDERLAQALQGAGASAAAAPGGGTAWGYVRDRATKTRGYDAWLPGNIEGLKEAASS